MSGRLIITTKKTYCPWNQQNVERVLRDERLERERVERETIAEKNAALAKRRGEPPDNRDNESSRALTRHVNLFPEAEEAELRLAQGRGGFDATTKNVERKDGIMPIPLGGEEASNRQSGHLPFYLQSHEIASAGSNINYTDRVLGRKVKGDAITGQIMRDQAVGREESRKLKMDPMMRFYTNGDCKAPAGGGAADVPVNTNTMVHPSLKSDNGNIEARVLSSRIDTDMRRHKSSKKGRTKDKRKRSRRDRYDNCSDASLCSSSNSSKRHSMKRKSKESKRSRKHNNDRGRDIDNSSNVDSTPKSSLQHADNDAIQQLRRKRMEREAREKQRQKDILDIDGPQGKFANDRDRGYQDQWNPMLSRK